jgi:hypothetical protein
MLIDVDSVILIWSHLLVGPAEVGGDNGLGKNRVVTFIGTIP